VGPSRTWDAKLTADSLSGSARVASVDVKDENLAAHLQSPEFFDAEQPSGAQLRVALDRAVGRRAEGRRRDHDPRHDEARRARRQDRRPDHGRVRQRARERELETTVDRTEFGLNWNMPLPNGQPALQNEVKLVAELYFVREA
jgi:polyisoprenoid-binding protein YceI